MTAPKPSPTELVAATLYGVTCLAQRYFFNLISVFLTEFRYFSYEAATQLNQPQDAEWTLVLHSILPE